MRNPLRTEAEAFSFVLVVGVLFLAVAVAAVVGGGELALAVFLALGIGVGAGIYLRSEPKVKEAAVWDRKPDDDVHRVLVVANETVAGSELRREIMERGSLAEVLVVTPALNSRIRHWTSDEDHAREEAQARLDVSVSLAVGRRGEGPRPGGRRRSDPGDRRRASHLSRGRDRHLDASRRAVELAGEGRRRPRARALRLPDHPRDRGSRSRELRLASAGRADQVLARGPGSAPR